MKRTRKTPDQIIRKLKTADLLLTQGQTVANACLVLEVSQSTYPPTTAADSSTAA